ncbi:MAG: undecaprenyl-phosphate glucose phosphotransferase [Bacteroidota bacterium]
MTRYSRYIKVFSIISDLVLLNVCFITVFYYKTHGFNDPFTSMFFYINFAWVFLIGTLNPYRISRTSTFFNILKSATIVIAGHMLLVFAYYVFQQEHRYSRELLLVMYSCLLILSLILKSIFFQAIKVARKKGFNYRNIIIYTAGGNSGELQTHLNSHPEYGYHIKKVFDVDPAAKNNFHEEMREYCIANDIHEIFYSMSVIKDDHILDLMNFAEENLIRIRLVADFKGMGLNDLEIENFGYLPVIKILTTPLDDWDKQLLKRLFDLLFSLSVIVLILSWLLPILAILIKITSKGPVFFKQQRTGRDNRPFWCYKLRTMYQNGESDTLQATKNDVRITTVGKFLRNTSLDELPQFFNVFLGNMSVVGPRPHMLKHTLDFSAELERFMVRHQIKPGITGLAQSKGYRGETSEFEQKKNRVKLDLFYVKHWSFSLDIQIIFNTIFSLSKSNQR